MLTNSKQSYGAWREKICIHLYKLGCNAHVVKVLLVEAVIHNSLFKIQVSEMTVEYVLLDQRNFGSTLFNNEDVSELFWYYYYYYFPVNTAVESKKSGNSDGVKNELHPPFINHKYDILISLAKHKM